MPVSPPLPRELFGDGPDTVTKFEALKDKIKSVISNTDAARARGDILGFENKVGTVYSPKAQAREILAKAGLEADLTKEWETGSPIATTPVQYTGYTPYNYEDAVLMIVPLELKLRNKTAREKGIGQGLEYRRVTGVSNSASGGVADLSPFFSSVSNTVTVNGTTLNRPPLISYAGDTTFKPYVEMGFTDAVSMKQQFAGQGFTDTRALSHLALIWAFTLGEERALLNARSVVINVAGASGTAADDDTVVGSGLPGATATAVYATFSSSFGESKAITLTGTPTTSAGDGIKITSLVGVPAGTIAINIYANYSGTYYKGTTVLTDGSSPLKFATVGALPSTSVDNGSANTLGYDGAISEFTSSVSGYNVALNAALGLDTFTTALQTMYIQNGADPDMILTTGSITQAAFDLIQSQGTATSYRSNYVTGDNGITVGGAVTGFVNPATGKVVEFSAHRYMPAGVAVIHSTQVPWAGSNVTATMKVSNVVDTMVLDWPVIGMSYDQSVYQYGTLVFEAPILSGCVTSINN